MQPETPVDGYLSKEIDPVPCASALESRDIEEAGYDEPGRVDAQITADEEMFGRRILHPREPETYSAEKEEHVYTDITHSPKPEKGIFSRQCYMKEDDEQHGCSHQLAAKPADIRQFYIFNLPIHAGISFLFIMGDRRWNRLERGRACCFLSCCLLLLRSFFLLPLFLLFPLFFLLPIEEG